MQIIAHRGFCERFPENTLPAFQAAAEMKPDAIEMDCLLSKDGQIVIRHDPWVEWEGSVFAVEDMTFEQLRRLDVGLGCRIPSLEEVLKELSGSIPLVLDLKQRGLARKLEPWFARSEVAHRLHVTSFIHEEILEVRQRWEAMECSITMMASLLDPVSVCHTARVNELSLARNYIDAQFVRRLRSEGLSVRVYTVNNPKDAQMMNQWGVKAIYTDALAAMQSAGVGEGS